MVSQFVCESIAYSTLADAQEAEYSKYPEILAIARRHRQVSGGVIAFAKMVCGNESLNYCGGYLPLKDAAKTGRAGLWEEKVYSGAGSKLLCVISEQVVVL